MSSSDSAKLSVYAIFCSSVCGLSAVVVHRLDASLINNQLDNFVSALVGGLPLAETRTRHQWV
jgi:hypothetical protein